MLLVMLAYGRAVILVGGLGRGWEERSKLGVKRCCLCFHLGPLGQEELSPLLWLVVLTVHECVVP
jgi:hypothetical protein